MFKLFRKKLTKKGFTLAELLIVVAIIAILVAIAVPVFAKAMEEAQIAVNTANVRSVKGAAVVEILAKWNDKDTPMNEGLGAAGTTIDKAPGWYAYGHVDENGNITAITVKVNGKGFTVEGVTKTDAEPSTNGDIAPLAESGKIKAPYYAVALIKPSDLKAAKDS